MSLLQMPDIYPLYSLEIVSIILSASGLYVEYRIEALCRCGYYGG